MLSQVMFDLWGRNIAVAYKIVKHVILQQIAHNVLVLHIFLINLVLVVLTKIAINVTVIFNNVKNAKLTFIMTNLVNVVFLKIVITALLKAVINVPMGNIINY